MARLLLQIIQSPEDLLVMTGDELSWALLEDMQARLGNPTLGMANRESLSRGILPVSSFQSNPQNIRTLAQQLDKVAREAFDRLEKWGVAEPSPGINGRNGYIVLTDKGRATTERTDLEHVRMRCFLKEEMLHRLLRGTIFGHFAAANFGTAVFEAFKVVEIEVRNAGNFGEKEHGKSLMFKAFAVNGPLTRPGDDKADCEALSGLFVGALNRFRNPGGHTNRTYGDVLEAMEELMFASRLLRIIDERRPK